MVSRTPRNEGSFISLTILGLCLIVGQFISLPSVSLAANPCQAILYAPNSLDLADIAQKRLDMVDRPDNSKYSYSEIFKDRLHDAWSRRYRNNPYEETVSTLELFLLDKAEGKKKLRTLSKLGFGFNFKTNSVDRIPSWIELAKNYRLLMEEQKVPENERIIPAIVLYRETQGKREYKMVDPLSEDLALEAEGYLILNQTIEFNIPYNMIIRGLKEGKFPMIGGLHDLSHFVAFANYPWAAKILRRAIDRLPEKQSPSFKRRLMFMLETFSMPAAAKPELVKEIIASIHPSLEKSKKPNWIFLRSNLNEKDEATLVAYAKQISDLFDGSLEDVSGGMSSSEEFAIAIVKGSFDVYPSRAFRSDSRSDLSLERLSSWVKFYRHDGPIPKNTFSRNATASEAIVLSPKTVAFVYREVLSVADFASKADDTQLAEYFYDHSRNWYHYINARFPGDGSAILTLKPDTRDQLFSDLKDMISTIEVMLLGFNSQKNREAFFDEMLLPELSRDTAAANLLLEIYNNTILERFYLGYGEIRAGGGT